MSLLKVGSYGVTALSGIFMPEESKKEFLQTAQTTIESIGNTDEILPKKEVSVKDLIESGFSEDELYSHNAIQPLERIKTQAALHSTVPYLKK